MNKKTEKDIDKILKRYKIRLIKKYEFELDGISEDDVKRQVCYIMGRNDLLNLPYIKKNITIKIKENHDWEKFYE